MKVEASTEISIEQPSDEVPVDLPVTDVAGIGGVAVGSSSSEGATRGSLRGNSGASSEGTTGVGQGSGSILVADGDGMSRPFGSIHDGFQIVDGTPQAENKKSDAQNLSERGTQMLREPLWERDKALGLGADGPVITALESSAQASTAPVDGKAVFDVVVGSDGMVASVTVSEGGIAWSGVARDAMAAVRGKKARVPGAAKNGIAMKIQIESRVLLPSGHSASTALDIAGIPLKKGDDKSTKVSLLKPEILTVPLDPQGNIQIPMVNFNIISTNGDPADIGARPRRVIHAKVIREELL